MRTFDPIRLILKYEGTVWGQCGQCGNGATQADLDQYPYRDFYQVSLVGDVEDSCGVPSSICVRCYEATKQRTFAIFMRNGEDILVELDTMESVMVEIGSFLVQPDEYARYAPFRVVAMLDGAEKEHIATIDMPEADKLASRKANGGEG